MFKYSRGLHGGMSMSKGYRCLSIILVLCLIMGLNITTYASAPKGDETSAPSADFIRLCDQVFSGNGKMYNASGDDITNNFISKYTYAYTNKDYQTVLSGCFEEEVYQIDSWNVKKQAVATRSIMQIPYERFQAFLVTQNGFPYDGKSWYVIITASGQFGYQESTNQIFDFPVPTISVSFSDLGALFSGNLDSVRTTTPVLNSSKKIRILLHPNYLPLPFGTIFQTYPARHSRLTQ